MSINIKQTYQAKPTNPIDHPPIILTNFDTLMPKTYIRSHYFFKNDDNKEGFMDTRKIFSSLEDILVDYYPLAGRLKSEPDGRLSILPSDQGVPFVIAESPDITIKQFEEKNWEVDSVPDGLLPVRNHKAEPDGPLLAVQHTTLADGSVVLGVASHHSITDGNGLFSFFETWGRKARKETFTPPEHDRSLLKPSGNPPSREHHEFIVYNPPQDITNFQLPQVARKIFYFSKENLKKLRDTYSSNNPTDSWISTNDALVAHICRTVAKARGIPLDEKISCAYAVDLRNRFDPPLPPSYFGNAVISGYLKILVSELINEPRSKIALTFRERHTEIDDSRARSALDWLEQQPNKDKITANLNFGKDFFISNWSKFPMYAIDFGYGTPIKYRQTKDALPVSGFANLYGTPIGDGGIEMIISLSPEHMQNLEQDPEFNMFLLGCPSKI